MARRVGVVFQDFETQIFSSTCLLEVAFGMENLCQPPDVIRRRASELLALVGLEGFEGRDPASLSGGEKQRLVIAAVLALETPVLVLDEPASDLDTGGREEVYRVIAQQRDSARCRSVLLVEHDLEGIPRVDGGTLMKGGRVVEEWEDGSFSTLTSLAGSMRASGVRPPPIAALAAAIRSPDLPLELDAPTPEALDAALTAGGWRVRADPGSGRGGAPHDGPVLLRCESITREFPSEAGSRLALDIPELIIREGEMISLIGPNGSGKTTLAHILAGLQPPTSGRVLLRGRSVSTIPARERALELGFVFQNPDHQIFAATVAEEVAFGPRNFDVGPAEVERRVASALEATGLAESRGEDPFTMTKGERQRLALASILACEPSVIIMDEPTTGLDRNEQESVMTLLARLNRQGHTIVIITHALWLVREPVRRAIVLVGGRIAADGSPRKVLTSARIMSDAGLRMPDLARLAGMKGVALLSAEEWVAALVRPGLSTEP